MDEKKYLYEQVEDLRKQVQENETAMKHYRHLKKVNKGDMMYGWEFMDDAILNDTLEDLDMYQDAYVRDVLRVYKGELETILYKSNF